MYNITPGLHSKHKHHHVDNCDPSNPHPFIHTLHFACNSVPSPFSSCSTASPRRIWTQTIFSIDLTQFTSPFSSCIHFLSCKGQKGEEGSLYAGSSNFSPRNTLRVVLSQTTNQAIQRHVKNDTPSWSERKMERGELVDASISRKRKDIRKMKEKKKTDHNKILGP